MFGCSFAYGDGLKNEEALHFKLQKASSRNTYNLSISGGSPKEILYLLREDDIRRNIVQINEPVEYVIYVYIEEHLLRLYSKIRPRTPIYSPIKKESDLKLNNNFFMNLIIVNTITEKIFTSDILKKRMNKIFKLHIKTIHNEVQKKYPNSQFVILVYDFAGGYKLPQYWDDFKKDGIRIIQIKDIVDANLTDIEYKISDNLHPNEKAWEIIVPALVKELNL